MKEAERDRYRERGRERRRERGITPVSPRKEGCLEYDQHRTKTQRGEREEIRMKRGRGRDSFLHGKPIV